MPVVPDASLAGGFPFAFFLPAESSTPTWTTSQVLYLLGAVVLPLVLFLGGIFKLVLSWWIDHLKSRLATAEAELADAQREGQVLQGQLNREKDQTDQLKCDLAAAGRDLAAARKEGQVLKEQLNKLNESITPERNDSRLQEIRDQLNKTQDEFQVLTEVNDRTKNQAEHFKEMTSRLQAELGKAIQDLDGYQKQLRANNDRLKKALKLEGRIWVARALQKVPKFRLLGDRRHAIISVLNLKGGVGKTTITAHLGAALAQRGYRVLLVDLDLQGSLSSMFLPPEDLTVYGQKQHLLQHFLNKAAEDKTTKIFGYSYPILDGTMHLAPATDLLAYAELNITMKWLLQSGERDTRFLLRKALQLKSVGHKHDIVLLDCPPLFNISCINALAASDYVLIPVLPSRKAAERVPFLLRRLREEKFRKYVNHDLDVLGLVANRTYGTKLTDEEGHLWDELRDWCNDQKYKVHRFETPIPTSKEIRESEVCFSWPQPESRLGTAFGKLAVEVEGRLPSECRRSTTTPS